MLPSSVNKAGAVAGMTAINGHLNKGQPKDQSNDIFEPKPIEGNDHVYTSMILSDPYYKGFIRIISTRRPGLMGQIDTLLSRFRARHRRQPLSETDFGFFINFGDIQRLYIRSLHARLISMSVRAQKRSSSKRPEDALEGLDNFGATLEKYSKLSSSMSLASRPLHQLIY